MGWGLPRARGKTPSSVAQAGAPGCRRGGDLRKRPSSLLQTISVQISWPVGRSTGLRGLALAVRELPTRADVMARVAGGVLLQVVLVLFLGFPEVSARFHLGDD